MFAYHNKTVAVELLPLYGKKENANRKEPRKRSWTETTARRMTKIKTRHQICSSQRDPMCFKEFVTNSENTVCVRCR